jgi:hypothetical protein
MQRHRHQELAFGAYWVRPPATMGGASCQGLRIQVNASEDCREVGRVPAGASSVSLMLRFSLAVQARLIVEQRPKTRLFRRKQNSQAHRGHSESRAIHRPLARCKRRQPNFGDLVSRPQDLLPRPFTHRVIGRRPPCSKLNRDRECTLQ